AVGCIAFVVPLAGAAATTPRTLHPRAGLHAQRLPIRALVRYTRAARFGLPHGFGGGDIYAMNADGSNQVNLTNDNSVDNGYASWPPDGTHTAFTRGASDAEVYVMDADGANLVNLTNN